MLSYLFAHSKPIEFVNHLGIGIFVQYISEPLTWKQIWDLLHSPSCLPHIHRMGCTQNPVSYGPWQSGWQHGAAVDDDVTVEGSDRATVDDWAATDDCKATRQRKHRLSLIPRSNHQAILPATMLQLRNKENKCWHRPYAPASVCLLPSFHIGHSSGVTRSVNYQKWQILSRDGSSIILLTFNDYCGFLVQTIKPFSPQQCCSPWHRPYAPASVCLPPSFHKGHIPGVTQSVNYQKRQILSRDGSSIMLLTFQYMMSWFLRQDMDNASPITSFSKPCLFSQCKFWVH